MTRRRRKKRNNKIIPLLIILIIIAILVPTMTSLSKYVYNAVQDYYLGSRAIMYERGISDYMQGIATEDEIYGIRYISQNGELSFGHILENSTGAGMNHYPWHQLSDRGIRPVIKLKKDITILAGTGTKDDPYILK